MSGIKEILVPIDYAPPSVAALRLAGELAAAFRARLTVLHLVPIEVYAAGDFPIMAADDQRLDEERARLDAHVRGILGDRVTFDTIVSWGSPFLQIVDYAIERHADLIVLGTHGRTGLRHAFLGSVAEKTVRLAPCPVLTAHDGAALARILGVERRAPLPAGQADVGSVMHREPVVVAPNDTLEVVRARLADADVRHLPVVESGRVVGMVTDRDIQPFLGHLAHTRVNAVMTPDPATVTADVSVPAAAQRMVAARVRALPVVEGERLVGIITTTDILEDYIQAARG